MSDFLRRGRSAGDDPLIARAQQAEIGVDGNLREAKCAVVREFTGLAEQDAALALGGCSGLGDPLQTCRVLARRPRRTRFEVVLQMRPGRRRAHRRRPPRDRRRVFHGLDSFDLRKEERRRQRLSGAGGRKAVAVRAHRARNAAWTARRIMIACTHALPSPPSKRAAP